MRPGSDFRDHLFGSGLVVALTVLLALASVLAAFGLFLELVGARTVVITRQAPTLIASQVMADPLESAAASDNAAVENDPSADPSGVHAETPDLHEQAEDAAGGPADGAPAADLEPPAVAEEQAKLRAAATRARRTPGPRGAPRASADVPIVMYHHVGPLPPNPDVYRRDLTVSADLFERTLVRLAEQGVETVTMADLLEHFAGGTALPKRAVVLTFDDGYDDHYEHAFRLLKEHGMVATFFITTDFVGRPGYLTWDQVVEMAEAGMEIAAHSANHADFTKIGPAELRRQLVEPKAILEQRTGQPVRFLAYPAGKYNAAVMAATRAAGYEAAVTVLHGTRHVRGNAFDLRRVRARGADTVSEIVTRMTPSSWRN